MSICFRLVDLQLQILGLQGAKSIEMVRLATQNMSNAEFAAVLSTTSLTEAERLRLIAGRQLTDAELEKALATNIASNANVGATATTFSLTNAFNKLGLSIRGVGAAAMSNPITAIITVALTAITVISQVKSHIEQAAAEAEQKAEEAAGAIQQINETFKKTSETTEQIGERFAELSQGVDSFTGKNKSLTTDEYAEFLNLSNQLAEMFPTLTRNYDENGNAIVNLSGDVDTIVGSLKNLVEVQREVANQEIVNNLPNLYEGAIKKSREYRIESQTYQEEIDDTISAWEGINGGFVNGNMMSIRAPVNSLEELEKVEQVYLSVLDDLGIVYQYADNIDGIRYKINSFSDMNEKEIEDTKAKIENGVKEALLSDTTLNKYFDDSYKKIEEQYGRIIDLNTNKSKAVWNNVTQSIYAWLQTDSTFQVLDDNLQTAIQKMISGVDFSELNNGKGFDNWDELSNYIVTNVIDPIAQATPEAQEALRGLFDVDFATATLKDYLTKIKPYLASIAQALGKTEEEVVTLFGLNDEITDFESMSAKREEILDSISERKDEYQKWLDGLSQSDFEIVYTLWLEGKVVNDVNSAKKELDKYKLKNTVPLEAFNTLLTDKGTAKDPHFIDEVDSYIEKTNKLNSAFEKFSKGDFDNEDFDKLIREFPQLATRSDDLGVAINELKEQMNSGISDRFAEELGKMPTKEDKDALLAWQQAILNVGKTTNEVVAQLSVDNNKAQQVIKGIDTAQKILSAQKSGQSISVEEFNSDEFKDYRSALEYVNGALHINEKKVREITKTKAKEYIETNKVNKANAQSKYLQNARQIALYRAQIEKGTYEKQYEIDTIKESIDNLLEENKTLAESCNQYDLLSASLQEATDSYEHWLNAQNATDYGDMMSDAESAIKLISDTFNENSDIYGQVGSKKYQAALELIIPDSVNSDNAQAVKNYVDKLKKYFYFNEDDTFAGMDIQKFISDSLNAGLMVLDQKSNEYKIAGGKTMEDFAEGLKLSSGMVQAFFDEMQLYGGKFDWSDEAIRTMGDLAIEAHEAYEALRKIKSFKKLDIRLDYSDIPDTKKQIEFIENNLKELKNYKSKLKVDSTEYQQALDIMQYLFRQKQSLEAPTIMSVDISQVNEKYKEAISLLKDYQNALDDKAILEYFDMNTSSADEKLLETKQKLINLDPQLKKELKITTTTDEAIKESIKKFNAADYQKTINFVAETEEVDKKAEEVSRTIDREVHYYATGVGSLPNSYSLGRIEREVHYYKTGDIDLNGTAHISGTAKIGGDWGTAKGGKTLVGELGREIVVDPRTGRWYTVGDNGAQFVDIPKGAIVFNHIQSQSLLENGYVSGRAHALVSGTAMVTGGIGVTNVGYSSKRKSIIEQQKKQAVAEEISDIIPDVEENIPENSFKYIDRIEILLDRIHRKIDAVKDAIGDMFSLWGDRSNNISKQIRNITDEIGTQEAAARRYLEEARKQIDKYGLDPGWVEDIENGGIAFSYLTNLDELHEGYEEYRKWYEKYLDARDTIQKLNNDLSQLYKDEFDNIKSNYDNQIKLNEYLQDSNEKTYHNRTTYFDDMRKNSQANLKLLTKKAQELETQLKKAFSEDKIEEGSEAWQNMQQTINDTTKEIAKTRVEIAALYNEEFDYIKNNYDDQIKLNEYLQDSDAKTYTQSTDYFNSMRNVHSKNLVLLTNKAKDLSEQLQKAVDSGLIEEGSKAWNDMKSEINGVTVEISKTNVELAKLYSEEFDYIQNNFQSQISSYASLNDANEKNFTKTTKYFSEMRNISKKTLSAQEKELETLEKEFDEAVNSGRIEEGSEAWYKMSGAIDDTKRNIAATKVELKQLYLDEFNYIQNGFKNQLSTYEHYANVYKQKATLAETQGYQASSQSLAAQRKMQTKNTSILREELSKLEKELTEAVSTGEIEKYSEAWYGMQSAIDATKEAIYNSRIETEKLNKAMQELDWQKFDFGQNMIGQINNESDFLINLLSFTDLYDKKGRLTDTGLATMGLRNVKVDTYAKSLKDYLIEATEVDIKLADDPENVDLIKRKQELLKLSRESAIAMENEQKAIVSMVEDGIKLELESLKELIDTYKEALDSEKDLYDYQKNIANKSKEIAALQKQISAYTNDTSEETRTVVQKLTVDLTNAQEDLADTEYNQSISDQKKLLDDIYDEYEAFLNTRLDDTNKLLEDMRMVTNAIPDRIGEVLRDTSSSASIHLSDEMNNIWNEASSELKRWNENAEVQKQVTRETLNAADASWGSFGEALRGSVVDKYSETNENINGVHDKSNNIKTAVDMNAHGIETVFNDLEHQSGQIVANSDNNTDSIKDEIYKRDDLTEVRSEFTTTNDALKKIEEHVKRIEEEAERMAAPFMGDVDLDDNVTSADSLMILRSGVKLENLTENQKKLADLDGNGKIDSADSLMALRTSVGLEEKVRAKSYSTGGLADYTGIANIHGSKENPELVLNAQDTKNFIKLNDILREAMKSQNSDLLCNMHSIDSPILQLSKIPSVISGISSPEISQNTTINVGGIHIDHVQDYNDLVNQMAKDPKFEKMLKAINANQLGYGNSMDKHKYRW